MWEALEGLEGLEGWEGPERRRERRVGVAVACWSRRQGRGDRCVGDLRAILGSDPPSRCNSSTLHSAHHHHDYYVWQRKGQPRKDHGC